MSFYLHLTPESCGVFYLRGLTTPLCKGDAEEHKRLFKAVAAHPPLSITRVFLGLFNIIYM